MPATITGKKCHPLNESRKKIGRQSKGNEFVHVTTPAGAEEIRRTYHISKAQAKRVLNRLRTAGVKM